MKNTRRIHTASFYLPMGHSSIFPGHAGRKRKRGFDGIPKNLPILLISGEEDPVGEGGRGVRRAMEDLQETGCTNVAMQLYPGARHELFHEINREEVFGDIVDWVSKL